MYQLKCVMCHAEWNERETATTCKSCNGALDVVMNLEEIAEKINRFHLEKSPLSAAKYLDFYPIKNRKMIVSLDEGNTPLARAKKIGEKYGIDQLFVKNEGANPTGVFKDRGSLVEVSKAKELGAKAICVASTGNMAASVAAYAARAELPCFVFVPEGTPIGKLAQTLSYGGKIVQIRGTYADCVEMAQKIAEEKGYYLAGDYAFRAEGAKSTAYEIIEQLHWRAPDVVICPVGCGTNLAGIFKGFEEFYALGLIEKIPKMIAVQPINCDTVCAAFLGNETRFTKVENPKTVASAVGIGVPQDDIKCFSALRKSKGYAETATEEEILSAQKLLASTESIFVEPSGAIPIAVLPKLLSKNIIQKNDVVVAIATGVGLKDPKAALGGFSEPISVDPNLSAIQHFLETGTPQISEKAVISREKIAFETIPSEEEIRKILEEYFEYSAEKNLLQKVETEIELFLRRGKEITFADLLGILEEEIEMESIPISPLQIKDFEVLDSAQKAPTARIEILFENEVLTGESNGVGPVDALLNALKKATLQKTEFFPSLQDYEVNILGGLTSAVVRVKIQMTNGEAEIMTSASNPDIVVASLSAFVKGFNMLFSRQK